MRGVPGTGGEVRAGAGGRAHWPVAEKERPAIARLWSPWITQSCWRTPWASGRDDHTRIFGSLPTCPEQTVTPLGWRSRAVTSSSWPTMKATRPRTSTPAMLFIPNFAHEYPPFLQMLN